MPPVRAGNEAPPLRDIIERDRSGRTDEHHTARHQRVVWWTRRTWRQLHSERFPIGFALGGCQIPGRVDELAKLSVRDMVLVDPEPVQLHGVGWPLIGLCRPRIATHHERAGK